MRIVRVSECVGGDISQSKNILLQRYFQIIVLTETRLEVSECVGG